MQVYADMILMEKKKLYASVYILHKVIVYNNLEIQFSIVLKHSNLSR